MNYKVEKGIVYSENGLPYAPRWFCDGRIAFRIDNESITEIDYFGPKTNGSLIAFLKRFWRGMTFYTISDNSRKMIRPYKCKIYPFGYEALSEKCEYRIYTGEDSIFFAFCPQTDLDVAVEFYDEFLFYPETGERADVRYFGMERSWSKPKFAENTVTCSYSEEGVDTNVAFTANTAISLRRTARNTKNVIDIQKLEKGKEYVFSISFSNGETKIWERYDEVWEKQVKRYEKVAENAPVLKSERPLLNQFFQLAPMYHESMKTLDVPGGIRAQSTHYWIWGWDCMTSNESVFYWGDCDFIGQMLDCMRKYADEKNEIAHCFSRDMKNIDPAAPPAQGMYITLLDLYRVAGGDWQQYYPFARNLFNIIAATEVRDTGLCRGISLYPDFRNLIKETGNDISAFNNTVSYCAVRSMEKLAESIQDYETVKIAAAFAERMRNNFEKLLFDADTGFIDSSIDADTYEHRGVPSNNAVKWENNFCKELMKRKAEEYLDFYEKHLISPAGLRPVPEWNECYDADANQLHSWWPIMSEFYTRIVNLSDRPDLMAQYAEWVEYWTEKIMCPEGINCYANEKEVPCDLWDSASGIWQTYTIRGFYNALVHSYVGIDFDENGLNIYPYSSEPVALENLHFGKMTFDVEVCGSGKNIREVWVNGNAMGSIRCVPFDKMELKNTVKIVRTK